MRKTIHRISIFALLTLGALGLSLFPASADSFQMFCINGELFVTHTDSSGNSITMSLGYGEWTSGNMSTTCDGDRARTVYRVEDPSES